MKYLDKKPFSSLNTISHLKIEELIKDLPYKYEKLSNKNLVLKKSFSINLIKDNWNLGSQNLNKEQINLLSRNKAISFIKKKLNKAHNLKDRKLKLKNGCIFYPAKCKYLFNIKDQGYIYHKYHLDSSYKFKVLIMLEDSQNEYQQFSYIKRFPENLLSYYIKRHFWGKFVTGFHIFLYYASLKVIRLSGQPPRLPEKYQNPKLYKHFNNLKKGQMISFHNLYPHSSHNGFSKHTSPMLQLVFDI